MKILKKYLLPLLLACFLWLAAGSTSRAEGMYQISESELTRLEVNLNQLAKNNETKQQLLTEQMEQSLTELEKEAKRKIKVKTRQRNLWIAISGGLLYAWIKK